VSHSVFVNCSHNLSIERRPLYHSAIAAPAKSLSPMPRCQENVMCSWGVIEKPTIREKGLSQPWLFAVISCKKIFIRFWEEGQYKPKTTGALTFLVCGRMSSISFVHRTFDWDGWNGFVWRGRCRDCGTNGPQVSMPVNRGAGKFFAPLGKMFWM